MSKEKGKEKNCWLLETVTGKCKRNGRETKNKEGDMCSQKMNIAGEYRSLEVKFDLSVLKTDWSVLKTDHCSFFQVA